MLNSTSTTTDKNNFHLIPYPRISKCFVDLSKPKEESIISIRTASIVEDRHSENEKDSKSSFMTNRNIKDSGMMHNISTEVETM